MDDHLEFVPWCDPMTISLNGTSGHHSAKVFVKGIHVYFRVKQPLIVIPLASGLCVIGELDRRAVALICWYDNI